MLNILSGQETANVKSFAVASGQTLDQGDWVVFDSNELKVQSGVYTGTTAVFPVYAGNVKFYDTKFMNHADVVTSKACVLETDKVAAVTINAGDPLTLKDGAVTTTAAEATGAVIGYAIKPMTNGVLQFILG